MAQGSGFGTVAIDSLFKYLFLRERQKEGVRAEKKLKLTEKEEARLGRMSRTLTGRETQPEIPLSKKGEGKFAFRKQPTARPISRHIPGTLERAQTLAERKQTETERQNRLEDAKDEQMRQDWFNYMDQPFETDILTKRRLQFQVMGKNYLGEGFDWLEKRIDEGRYPTRLSAYRDLKGIEGWIKKKADEDIVKDLGTAVDKKELRKVEALTAMRSYIKDWNVDKMYGITPQSAPILFGRTMPTKEKPTVGRLYETEKGWKPREEAVGLKKPEGEKLTKGEKKLKTLADTFYKTIGRANSARMGVGQFIPDPNREKVAAQEYKRAKELVKQYVNRGGKLSDLGIPDITEEMYLFYQDKYDLTRKEVLKRYLEKLNLADMAKQ